MPSLRKIGTLGTPGPRSLASATPKTPPPQKTAGRPLPNLSMPTKRPRGPLLYHLGQKVDEGTGGPGPPPLDFPGSGAEWVWFWASRKYYDHNDHIAPRQPPYDGGFLWQFQAPENSDNPREAGGSVSDFLYHQGGGDIIVRIEGFYWHIGRGAAQQARDLYLVNHAGVEGTRLVRVNDGEFMEDVTGSTAIKYLDDVLHNRPRVGSLAGGVVQAPRYADFALGLSGS